MSVRNIENIIQKYVKKSKIIKKVTAKTLQKSYFSHILRNPEEINVLLNNSVDNV